MARQLTNNCLWFTHSQLHTQGTNGSKMLNMSYSIKITLINDFLPTLEFIWLNWTAKSISFMPHLVCLFLEPQLWKSNSIGMTLIISFLRFVLRPKEDLSGNFRSFQSNCSSKRKRPVCNGQSEWCLSICLWANLNDDWSN